MKSRIRATPRASKMFLRTPVIGQADVRGGGQGGSQAVVINWDWLRAEELVFKTPPCGVLPLIPVLNRKRTNSKKMFLEDQLEYIGIN